MAGTKHTAGPWKLQILGQQKADLIHKGTFMGLDGGSAAPDVLDGDDAAEWEANARLIASAPELLGELKRMVEHFSAWANDHSQEATTETWAALYCARDVICKAEGSSHA